MVKNRSKAGFTLIEVMITIAILGTISAISAPLFLQAQRFFILTKARTDLQQEARGIMYVITRELHQAQSNSIRISRASNLQPYYSKITFTKQQGTTMTFLQSGNLLQQQSQTISKNLRYIAFSFPRSDDMTIVSVSMTLQVNIYEGKIKALHMASEKVRVMN